MKIIHKKFKDLSNLDLYRIYFLRSKVFVVEQNCPYQDVDAHDLYCIHVLGLEGDRLAAYSRLIPPSSGDPHPHIGRVVVDPEYRSKGLAKKIMQNSVSLSLEQYGKQDIIISAQKYLLKFYQDLGFEAEGEEYLEDNIPHLQMRYRFP